MALGWRANYLRYKEVFLDVVSAYQKKQSFKVFIELLLTVVTVVVFSVFALKPTIIAISGLLNEIETKEELVVQMDTKIQNIKRAQSTAQQNQQNLNLLDTALPDNADPGQFVSQMEGALSTSGLGVLGITIAETKLLGSPTIVANDNPGLEFSLNLRGSYTDFKSFMKTLENLRRPIEVQSVQLAQESTRDLFSGNSGQLILSVVATSPFVSLSTVEPEQ